MTPQTLAALAGILLSLIFSYVPGVHDWYARQTSETKSLIMAGCILAVAVGAFALGCAQLVNAAECSRSGAWQLVQAVVAALVANQGAYVLSPQRPAVTP